MPVQLRKVRRGSKVAIEDGEKPDLYMVAFYTEREAINLHTDVFILVNLKNGRIITRDGGFTVRVMSND